MENEPTETSKNRKNVLSKILMIIMCLLFVGAGFYAGYKDIFNFRKVDPAVNEESKPAEKPKEETKNEIKEGDPYPAESLYEEYYIALTVAIGPVYSAPYNDYINNMNVGESRDFKDFSEEEKFLIIFRHAVINNYKTETQTGESEDEYFNNGYASNVEYHISLEDLKNIASKYYNYELNTFPESVLYLLDSYQKNDTEYVGRTSIGGFVGPVPTFKIIDVEKENDNYIVKAVRAEYSEENEQKCDGYCYNLEDKAFEFIFEKTEDEYSIKNIKRVR